MITRCFTLSLLGSLAFAPLLSAQSPTFSRVDYASHAGARGIAAADFNRDGWIDVAHANTGRDSVTVLLNGRGEGSLAPSVDLPVGRGPFDIVSADLNRDGTPDLAVANADDDSISVLIGNGSGGFSRTDFPAAGNPRGITAADMNRDGRPDIVYTAYLLNRVQILEGDGAGGFAAGWSIVGVAHRPQGIAPGDFNHDGIMDVAVAYASSGGGLAILSGRPQGGFTAQQIPGEDSLNVVTAADLNRDGWIDVAAASSFNRLGVYYGGASGMRHHATYFTGQSPRGVAAADLNQDGRLDIVAANKESSTVSVFTAQASGSFTAVELAAGRGSRGVVAADFDHDGLLDLATGNQDEGSVSVLWNSTTLVRAGFAFRRLDGGYGFDEFYGSVVLGDFDHDGRLDRVNGAGTIFFGNGAQSQLPHGVGRGVVTELNGDGHADLAFWHPTQPAIGTLLGDGRGGFIPGGNASGWSSTASLTGMEVADVDRDGKADVIVTGYEWRTSTTEGFVHVMKGNGDGTFRMPSKAPLGASPWFSVADVNGDAILDLLLGSFRDHPSRLAVAFGDGTGAFPRMESYATPDAWFTVAHVADVNRDGRMDIVGGGFDGTHVLLATETGFAPPIAYDDTSYRISLGDFNADGRLDILLNNVARVRFGRGDGTFGDPVAFASFGSYPIAADMNNDGLHDIVVGDSTGVLFNLRQGHNTPPAVSAGEDMTVSYADTFNEDDENMIFISAAGFDADLHHLRYEWRDAQGNLLGTNLHLLLPRFNPGTYELTVTAFDDRGGSASDSMVLTITPVKEIVLYAFRGRNDAGWERVSDPTAAFQLSIHNPDRGAPKVTAPLADPVEYFELWFLADPTQEYKLWTRGKAQNDHWANDSAWVQFEHSLNSAGAQAYRIGTPDALPFNLEECSGCGISGWGWEDDGWGSVDAHGVTIRFAQGGWQRLRVQKREDGVFIDQIVLSAEQYLTTRPGMAKNDATILPEKWR